MNEPRVIKRKKVIVGPIGKQSRVVMPMAVALGLLLATLVGCKKVAEKPMADPAGKEASTAFAEPKTTFLGKKAAALAADRGGDSGFLLMDRGKTALAWRTILADSAEKSIDAQYFLWKNDEAGKVMMHRLMSAADRGVRVRVLIDDSMTDSDPQYLAQFGAYPNVELRLYKPFGPKHKSLVMRWIDYVADLRVLNRRMHNKLYLVDDSFAVAGGRNIGSDYFEYPAPFTFRSRDLLALGPVIDTAGEAFDLYWNSDWTVPIADVVTPVPTVEDAKALKASLDDFAKEDSSYPPGFYDDSSRIEEEMAALEEHLHWGKGHLLMDAVPEKDGKAQTHAELDKTGVVLGQIAKETTDQLYVQSAYLILLPETMKGLGEMVGRGVEVNLATNSMAANNHLSAFVGYRKQRKELLETGAAVFEMRPDAAEQSALYTAEQLEEHNTVFGLHAKTVVFDRKVAFVGSFNLDPRSVNLNTEMGWLVESESLAEAVAQSIEKDIAAGNSWQVILKDDGHPEWITVENGVVTVEAEKEPMTSAARRAEADALAIVPDDAQL
jgi:putative cardiolipin synthase